MPSLVSQRRPRSVEHDDGSPTEEKAPQKIAHVLTSLLPECLRSVDPVAEARGETLIAANDTVVARIFLLDLGPFQRFEFTA
jgi:hypothetical protein